MYILNIKASFYTRGIVWVLITFSGSSSSYSAEPRFLIVCLNSCIVCYNVTD